jgi:hypothetical protein
MLMCVCLRILASSRIPRYDLGRQTPHFRCGFITVHDVHVLVPEPEHHPLVVRREGRERVVVTAHGEPLDRDVVIVVAEGHSHHVHLGALAGELGPDAGVDDPFSLPVPRHGECVAQEDLTAATEAVGVVRI